MAETGGVDIGGNGFVEIERGGGVELVFDVVRVELRAGDAYLNPGFARGHLQRCEPSEDRVGGDGGFEFMNDWSVAVDFEAADLRDGGVAVEELFETPGDWVHVVGLSGLCKNINVRNVEGDGEK